MNIKQETKEEDILSPLDTQGSIKVALIVNHKMLTLQELWLYDIFELLESSVGSETEIKLKHADLVDGPKRKVALLFAYVGTRYHGLQMNRGERSTPTIEGALFKALVNAKVVPANCWEDPHKMSYRCASRTDRGVSTCGQVASLKLKLNEKVVDLINMCLPDDITILGVKRTTQGFNAQMHADARTYSYTMPTYAFADPESVSDDYRITAEKRERIKSILLRYRGTRSFHNFTSGKEMGQDSACRFIMDFYCDDPFVKQNMEFIKFTIKGQSFMIHQIRKMMGLLIVIISNRATEEHFDRSFSEPLEDIPKAPGTGLLLETVHYHGYNKRYSDLHGGIDFSDAEEKRKDFLTKRIMPTIIKEEVENHSMLSWMETLVNHDYTGAKAKAQWLLQQQQKMEKKNASKSCTDTVEKNSDISVNSDDVGAKQTNTTSTAVSDVSARQDDENNAVSNKRTGDCDSTKEPDFKIIKCEW